VRDLDRRRCRLFLVQRFQVRADLGIVNVEYLQGRSSQIPFQLHGAILSELGTCFPMETRVATFSVTHTKPPEPVAIQQAPIPVKEGTARTANRRSRP